LDELPESEIEPVLDFIASRGGDPVLQLLDNASEEDEEVSAEEEAAAAEGRADIAAGRTVSHEEMVRRYG
jgi:predicted transcriptional regulator